MPEFSFPVVFSLIALFLFGAIQLQMTRFTAPLRKQVIRVGNELLDRDDLSSRQRNGIQWWLNNINNPFAAVAVVFVTLWAFIAVLLRIHPKEQVPRTDEAKRELGSFSGKALVALMLANPFVGFIFCIELSILIVLLGIVGRSAQVIDRLLTVIISPDIRTGHA